MANVQDGKGGGGQGGVNKGVAVTAGFFFVGGIVEFDDQYRAEFVARAQDEAEPLGAARRSAEGDPKGEPSGSERVQSTCLDWMRLSRVRETL